MPAAAECVPAGGSAETKQQRAARIREDRARHIAEEQLLAGTRADPHYRQVVISGAHRTQDSFPGIVAHADFARDAEAIVLAQLDYVADGRARASPGASTCPKRWCQGRVRGRAEEKCRAVSEPREACASATATSAQ